MARYTIEDTTLTALGDAVRAHVGETKPAIVEAIYDFTATGNNTANNNDWVSRAYNFALRVPGASQVIVKDIVITTNTSPEEITFKVGYSSEGRYSSLPEPVYIYGSPDTPSEITSAASKVNGGLFFVSVRCPIEYTDITISLTATGLDAEGNILINKEIEVPYLMTPNKMIEELNNMKALPPEALYITGNCQYRFAYGNLNWLLEKFSDDIITESISSAGGLFYDNQSIVEIPITINLANGAAQNHMFYNCYNLKVLPTINNGNCSSNMFEGCRSLQDLNGYIMKVSSGSNSIDSMFKGCYSLRTIGSLFNDAPAIAYPGASIFGMYDTFYCCYSMDELINLPFFYTPYSSVGYSFGNCFLNCSRLKELTFRGGAITTTAAKSHMLSLDTYVGYCATGNMNMLKDFGGFTEETRVTDDISYQNLKDNPDWWTTDIKYSRYNHNSAVNTLNSLPDFSTLTSTTQTIKFKGESGSATDGGAINTLTEEEIAVATAKGWTVTLV